MSETAGSYDKSTFNFSRNCQTVFHSSCSILYSYHQCLRVPTVLHPQQHLILSTFFIIAILVGMNGEGNHTPIQ